MRDERTDSSTAADAEDVGRSVWSQFYDSVALWSHRIGGVLLIATVASRSLFPSEDAAEATGLYFVPLALACGVCYVVERTAGVRGPRFRWTGWAWALLLLCWWLSLASASYRYPAEILLWEWVGVAAVSLYARHWQASGGNKGLAALAVALVLHQSMVSAYQLSYEMPALREMEQRGDLDYLQALRQLGIPRGSSLEKAFRDRLHSNEPYGTTGHPNSLAGMLVLTLPLALTLAWSGFGRTGGAIVGTIVATVTAIGGMGTLLATRSRSAWIGFAVSMAALVLLYRVGPEWWKRNAIRLVVALAVLVSLAVGLVWGGVLDDLVVGESLKSFEYRLEWWEASGQVIAERPFVGVGGGNFRDHYLTYKLPFSSEEIADPHNFAIELLATGGVLTFLAYLGVLVLSIHGVLARSRMEEPARIEGFGLRAGWLAGCVVAIALVIGLHYGVSSFAVQPGNWVKVGFFVVAVLAVCAIGWTGVDWRAGSIRMAVVAGVLGLYVHLLAAGGVGFPSLATLTFCLLGVCSTEENDPRPVALSWSAISAGLVGVGIVLFSFFWLLPAIERDLIRGSTRSIERVLEKMQEGVSPTDVTPKVWMEQLPVYESLAEEVRRYAQSVPGDRRGWEQLAAVETARMRVAEKLHSPSAETAYRNALDAWRMVLELAPRRSESYRQLAYLNREAAASGRDPKGMADALQNFQSMIERYPNSAVHRWELAEQYARMDRVDEAANEFEKALELDQTPHLDRKLSRGQRLVAERFLSSRK